MKSIMSLIFLLTKCSIIFAQEDCLPAPKINFSGTPIEWSYLVVDTTEELGCLSFVDVSEQNGFLEYPFVLDGNNILVNIRHSSHGSIIRSINCETGSINWERYFNKYVNDDHHSSVFRTMKVENDVIKLFGVRSLSPYPNGPLVYYGSPLEKIISLGSGEDISTKKTDDKANSIYSMVTVWPHFDKKKGIYLGYTNGLVVNVGDYNDGLIPLFFDENFNKLPESKDTSNFILFKIDYSGGGSTRLITNGPIKENDSTYVYVSRYRENYKWRHFIWKVSTLGKNFRIKEITDRVNDEKILWYETRITKENYIRLITVNSDEYYRNRIRGYMDFDLDGNLIRDRKNLEINGKKIGHLIVQDLKYSDDRLLIVRHQFESSINFYLESDNGIYSKVGEMINPNSDLYLFLPKRSIQTDEGDIIFGTITVLDSVGVFENFEYGGWTSYFKINAEDLDLPTSIKKISQTPKIHLYPNPTRNIVQITQETPKATLNIIDQFGRLIKTIENITKSYTLSTDDMPAGIYFLQIVDRKNLIKGMEKLVVIR